MFRSLPFRSVPFCSVLFSFLLFSFLLYSLLPSLLSSIPFSSLLFASRLFSSLLSSLFSSPFSSLLFSSLFFSSLLSSPLSSLFYSLLFSSLPFSSFLFSFVFSLLFSLLFSSVLFSSLFFSSLLSSPLSSLLFSSPRFSSLSSLLFSSRLVCCSLLFCRSGPIQLGALIVWGQNPRHFLNQVRWKCPLKVKSGLLGCGHGEARHVLPCYSLVLWTLVSLRPAMKLIVRSVPQVPPHHKSQTDFPPWVEIFIRMLTGTSPTMFPFPPCGHLDLAVTNTNLANSRQSSRLLGVKIEPRSSTRSLDTQW